jgi:polyketide synthase PksJ
VFDTELGAFSRGLTRKQPGRWIWLGPVIAEERAKQIVDRLSETYGVPRSTIVVAAALLLLGRYHGVELVGATLDADDGALQVTDQPVSVAVSDRTRLIDLVSHVHRNIGCTGTEASLSAGALPCRLILRNAPDDGAALESISPPAEDMFAVGFRFGPVGYQIRICYRQQAHAVWLAEQFGRHLVQLLAEGMAGAETAAGDLTVLDPAEATAVLQHASGQTRRYPLERPLLRMFEDQVRRAPDTVALIGRGRDGAPTRLSYLELDRRSEGLARRLVSQGAFPGAAVGVHMERSIELVVALLAVWRAGCIYVPLDRSYPPEYVRYILEDTRAALLIADAPSTDGIGPAAVPVIIVDAANDAAVGAAFADPGVSTGDPCLIMYTSGSTGRPKGVVHCQRQIINRLHWMWETYPFTADDVIAQRSSMSVMPSVWELLGGLLAGVPTAVVPDALIRVPAEFSGFLADHRVSFITMTPTLLRMLLQARQSSAAWPQHLRLVVIGGEPLTEDHYQGFRDAFPLATMVNDFGATEVNTVLHVPLRPDRRRGIDEEGYGPIANVSTFILDDRMQFVPFGVQGELCVAGESVALNYLNLPEATAERFVLANPGNRGPAVRIYRTGDMGYMTPDGAIRITGRRDHQVKVNGHRVEFGEVERVLRLHPAIAECLVIDRPDPLSGSALGAFLVERGATDVEPNQLRQHVRQHLPPFMVPKTIEWVTALPRRPNGKLDRLALRDSPPKTANRTAPAATAGAPQPIVAPIRALAARILGADPAAIDPHVEFDALGLDSVAMVEFAQQLADQLARPVPVTALFEHPTISRLALHLTPATSAAGERLDSQQSAPTAGEASARIDGATAVAIIGISGRFPGALDVDQFWDNLVAGVESIGTVAFGRWNAEAIYDPDPASERGSYSKWGGFLADVDQFEPQFFGYSPAEARLMDPQQRLCLMESWRALEDAGYTGAGLADHHVGVYIGAREPDYPVLVANAGVAPSAQTLLGSDMSLLAARISYFCDLHGPSMVVDTACSSALVAVHLACRSLRDEECTMALAGAVSVTNDPNFYVATSKLNIFSPEGRCRAFDEKADGFVHGEGVGFVVLKRLDRAIADRDHIYAVIRGTAVNQDGRSNGITAPNQAAQSELQEALYRKLAIDPATIGYVEAHGTATPLGDPIEVQALARSFGRFTSHKQFCALGSVKTNIGHLTAAAGIAGLIKSALCLNYRQLVPSLHFDRANPLLDFADTPFYVNTACRPWQVARGAVRRAALNAFGIGGTNAHAVLEQAPPPDQVAGDDGRPYLIALTSTDPGAVSETIRRMQRWIERNGDRHAVRDLSFTLLVGRRLLKHGYLVLTSGMSDLAAQLTEIGAGRVLPTVWPMAAEPEGSSERYTAQLATALGSLRAANLSPADRIARIGEVAKLVAGGARTGLRSLYGDDARLISAPTTLFATSRCWVDPPAARPVAAAPDRDRTSAAIEPGLRTVIADAAAELLGVLALAHDQPLSRYGLDSLKAISLQHALERALALRVPLELLMASSSIDDLVATLAGFRSAEYSLRQSAPRDDRLIERFLDSDLDLDAVSDEQLDWLHERMLERMGAAHDA